jgi:uncharacterized glyoxalase superfamily protein PhnB
LIHDKVRNEVDLMLYNRSVPPVTVVPVLIYPDVRAAVAWLNQAFGFVERTRIGEGHRAQLAIGHDGAVILADDGGRQSPPADSSVTQMIRVRVDDVDGHFRRAVASGAYVVEPLTEHEYGERDYIVQDLAGHRWQFAETLRDVAPEEYGCETVTPWPSPAGI